jgi:hypothetical protein
LLAKGTDTMSSPSSGVYFVRLSSFVRVTPTSTPCGARLTNGGLCGVSFGVCKMHSERDIKQRGWGSLANSEIANLKQQVEALHLKYEQCKKAYELLLSRYQKKIRQLKQEISVLSA